MTEKNYMDSLCELYPHMAGTIQSLQNNNATPFQNVREFLYFAAKRSDTFRVPVYVGNRMHANRKCYIGYNHLLGRVLIDNSNSACPLEQESTYLCIVKKCSPAGPFGTGCEWRTEQVLALLDEEEPGKIQVDARVERRNADYIECTCSDKNGAEWRVKVWASDLREHCMADLRVRATILHVTCFMVGARKLESCYASIGQPKRVGRRCCAQIHQVYTVLERLFHHHAFRTRFLNLEENRELKRRFIRILMREDKK